MSKDASGVALVSGRCGAGQIAGRDDAIIDIAMAQAEARTAVFFDPLVFGLCFGFHIDGFNAVTVANHMHFTDAMTGRGKAGLQQQ